MLKPASSLHFTLEDTVSNHLLGVHGEIRYAPFQLVEFTKGPRLQLHEFSAGVPVHTQSVVKEVEPPLRSLYRCGKAMASHLRLTASD